MPNKKFHLGTFILGIILGIILTAVTIGFVLFSLVQEITEQGKIPDSIMGISTEALVNSFGGSSAEDAEDPDVYPATHPDDL